MREKDSSPVQAWLARSMWDIIVMGSSTVSTDRLVHQLRTSFSLKDLGELHYSLGIEVTHSCGGLLFEST
jgi:histone deacetylase 1/2